LCSCANVLTSDLVCADLLPTSSHIGCIRFLGGTRERTRLCVAAGRFAMVQVPVIRQILAPLNPLISLYFGFPFS